MSPGAILSPSRRAVPCWDWAAGREGGESDGDLGAALLRLREAKGASLDQVAATTKVGLHHLEALERGDFGALPDDVFVRGFIRAYAGFLGTDSEELLTLYRRDRERREPDAPQVAADRTVREMSRLLAGSAGPVGRAGLALRIRLDRNVGRLALRIGGLAAAGACVAALVIVLGGRREVDTVEALRPKTATPLRASRRATDVPPTSSTRSAVVPSPAPALSPPLPPAPTPAAPPVAETRVKPVDARPAEEGLEVPEHGVGSGVEGGQLAGRAAAFEEGAAVWFFTRVDGGRSGQIVRHVWLHEDREVHTVDLPVGSAQWRTWSRKTLRPGSTGRWSVEARDAYGRVLASDDFECHPGR
jgi:hypothetical protein